MSGLLTLSFIAATTKRGASNLSDQLNSNAIKLRVSLALLLLLLSAVEIFSAMLGKEKSGAFAAMRRVPPSIMDSIVDNHLAEMRF